MNLMNLWRPVALIALCLLGLSGCASVARQGEPTVLAPADQRLPQDPQVRIGTLENGLRYYIRPNNEPRNRAELRLVVNAGSVLEDDDQRGLAHFVEHMAFNGTRRFPKQALVDYLEGVGMRFGPDVNAYTSFDETVYQLTLPTDSAGVLETGFAVLEDWAHGVLFDSAEVRKERGVVVEEWRLGQGAGARLQDRHFPVLFGGSRYAERLPIGDRRTLETFDLAALQRFYREWYRPDLMAVVAVGDFDPAVVERLIRRHFGDIRSPSQPRLRAEFAIPGHAATRFSVASDPEATSAEVSLYLKRPAEPGGTHSAYRRWLVESLAGTMLVGRLQESLQRPDAPLLDVGSFQGRMLRPTQALVLNAAVRDTAPEAGLRALLTEVRRAGEHGFTASELQREKTELLRRMEQRYAERDRATSAGFAGEYVSHFLYGGIPTAIATDYALVQYLLPDITREETAAAAREWTTASDRVVLASLPAGPGVRVPSQAQLAAVVREVDGQQVSAYSETVSDAPLLRDLPQPGTVVRERDVPEIGVREWTLANGVRVILKPTDFQDDEILLAARSPGGTSLVGDSAYTDAAFATAAAQVGGVGEWDVVALGKRLAGTAASVGVSLGDLQESVSGIASLRDVETMFQLVHLYFTQPRRDPVAWEAYRSRARAGLANRALSPEAAFSDTLQVTLSQAHPRARPPSPAVFDSLDLDRSLGVFRDRFGDAGDFTFFLVGRFEPDSIRPLVERYLGSLPSAGRKERWRDVGVTPPRGVVRKTVRRGSEPKARTQIVFSGPLEFARGEVHALNSAAEVLQLRLRETVREELGGSYGVGVNASAARDPRPEYRVAVGFGSDPERLDELSGVVFAEIARLQREGPTAAEMAKVREAQRRAHQTALRENGFWLSQLMTYDRYAWDAREILSAGERIAGLTAVAVQRAAQRYFDTRNYVQVSLVPEGASPVPGSP
jgi:zinc protease